MESVDQVGRRERFMQSNFESLSGEEPASLPGPGGLTNSISHAWRGRGEAGAGVSAHQRNAGTIEAARQMRDAEQNRRREELQRRIEETRQKLQNVSQNLRYSCIRESTEEYMANSRKACIRKVRQKIKK